MSDSTKSKENNRTGIITALLAVYISWGSTYLAIRIALQDFPPFFMTGLRFIVVGIGLYAFLRIRGASAPNHIQWWNAVKIGTLLFLGGGAGVAYAEQWVPSGLTALVIATTPLWTVLFAGIWEEWPARLEWAGLLLGLGGIILLNFEGDLQASPLGAATLIVATASWAFGSAWSRRLTLPKGQMTGATQMIAGGIIVLLVSFIINERIPTAPAWQSIGAVAYLAVFGSLVGFSAYLYLLHRVRPALATSYAYVNPIFAVALGVWLAGEKITVIGISAMIIIVVSVVLVAGAQKRT